MKPGVGYSLRRPCAILQSDGGVSGGGGGWGGLGGIWGVVVRGGGRGSI